MNEQPTKSPFDKGGRWSFYGMAAPLALNARPISFYQNECFYLAPLPHWIVMFYEDAPAEAEGPAGHA